jgi:hypothetical protein
MGNEDELPAIITSSFLTDLQPHLASLEGKIASEDFPGILRMEVLSGLRHQIYQAEKQIRETDFPGWGDETEKNVVRAFLKQQVEAKLGELANNILAGTVTVEGYKNTLDDLGIILFQAGHAERLYESAPPSLKDKSYEETYRLALLGLVGSSRICGEKMLNDSQIMRISRSTFDSGRGRT